MATPSHIIKLGHARDYLRQHFAIDAGLENMDHRPLGSDPKNVDPETRERCRQQMQQCRDNAHWEISGMIGGSKITVWKERPDGGLEASGAKWAQQQFDAPGVASDSLYFDRVEWVALLQTMTSAASRAYFEGAQVHSDAALKTAVESALETGGASRGDGPYEWDDFGSECIPELQRLTELADRDEWWTWPEAVAWIGSRNSRNIATLRYWAQWWLGHPGATAEVILGAQHYIADRFCESGRKVEGDLVSAIERGAVGTSGRTDRDAKSAPLAKGDWRGGKVVYSQGVAVLASAENTLIAWSYDIAVRREDLVREFPSPSQSLAAAPTIDSPVEFESPQAEWLELWQGPLKFRATYDKGQFGPGHTTERMHQFADEGATGNGRHEPIYSVRVDEGDGAIIIEWLGHRGLNGQTQSVRYYDGLGRGLYEKLRDDTAFRSEQFRMFWILPEQYERAVGAFATAVSLQEWLRREFSSAIHAGQCEIWARAGSKVAPFQRIPADIFRAYSVRSWGFGQPGAAWAELEGAQSLYAIHVAPSLLVNEVGKITRRRGRTKGSGSMASADEPLLIEMRALIAAREAFSPEGAAKLVWHKAAGNGAELSKVTRLAKRFREAERN